MRLRGERAAERARTIVESFRPRKATAAPSVVLTGFGQFPGVTRNATSDLVRALAKASGIALCARSFRARDFVIGRGVMRLPSGRTTHASLMVLPVAWEAAAALVAKEARATRASLVIMSGVAAPTQPLFVEVIAGGGRVSLNDAFSMRPRQGALRGRELEMTLDTNRAERAARAAIASECSRAEGLSRVLQDAERPARRENAYVCNATAHVALALSRRSLRILRTGTRPRGVEIQRTFRPAQGFLHWPRDVGVEHAPACARILLSIVDALIAS